MWRNVTVSAITEQEGRYAYISCLVYSAFKNGLLNAREEYRKVNNVKFAVLTTVATKSTTSIFWDVKHHILVEVYRCFRGTNWLHLQGRRVGLASKQHEDAACISPVHSDMHTINFTPSLVTDLST
jgi:hypothetical protein